MFVLDASAVIAVIRREAGAEIVVPHLRHGIMSSVNASEVLYQSVLRGDTVQAARAGLERLQFTVIPFSMEHAATLASIYPATLGGNISFADRACMTLALERGLPVLTGDHEWADLDIGIKVKLFRSRPKARKTIQ